MSGRSSLVRHSQESRRRWESGVCARDEWARERQSDPVSGVGTDGHFHRYRKACTIMYIEPDSLCGINEGGTADFNLSSLACIARAKGFLLSGKRKGERDG